MTTGRKKIHSKISSNYCRMNCETFCNKIFFDLGYAVQGKPTKSIRCKLLTVKFLFKDIDCLGFFGCLNAIRCCCAENKTLIEQLDERLNED